MIKVLDDAIEKVRALPADRQVLAADLLEQIATSEEPYQLSDDEREAVREGVAELDRGEIASDDAVRSTFDKYRR